MNQPVNPNPSPRARFQKENGAVTAHRALLENPYFDKGADAAMLEYGSLVAQQAKDGNSAMAAGFRLQGAIEFLQVLKTLAESAPTFAPRKDLDNLPDTSKLTRQ